jgi:hypothetical protein
MDEDNGLWNGFLYNYRLRMDIYIIIIMEWILYFYRYGMFIDTMIEIHTVDLPGIDMKVEEDQETDMSKEEEEIPVIDMILDEGMIGIEDMKSQ